MVKNVIAVAVLIVLAVTAFLLLRERPSEERQEASAAISPVPKDRVDSIRILRHEGAEEILLKREGGGGWRMLKPIDAPVVEESVGKMVDMLSSMKAVDVISDNRSKHSEFEVDDKKGIEVKVTAGQEVLANIIIGASRGNMTYVRPMTDDKVYRVQGTHRYTFNRTSQVLRDKTVVDLEESKIAKISFKNEEEELTIERNGEGDEAVWTPVGREIENFNDTKAKGVVRLVSKLSAQDFADRSVAEEKTGLGEGAATVTIENAPGTEPATVTLRIGNADEGSRKTYLKSSTSDQIFLVSKNTADRLKIKADDLSVSEEEAAQEAERQAKAHKAALEARMAEGGDKFSMTPSGQKIPPDLAAKLREADARRKAEAAAAAKSAQTEP